MSAGGILLVYPRRESVTRVSAMGAELAIAAVGVLLAGGAVGALLLRLGLARPVRDFDAIDEAIMAFERDGRRWLGAGFLLTFASAFGQTWFVSRFVHRRDQGGARG